MKRLIALVLAGLMVLGGACFAAQWPEGCSPAQPYSHLPEVNLTATMGYIMMFPRAKLPASRFCNQLRMFLPRTDIAAGSGQLRLFESPDGKSKGAEICAVDFSNPDSITIREMSEKELEDLIWGSGTCVEINLPKSLEFGDGAHNYYVTMDEGCFTAVDGSLKSIGINNVDAWMPLIEGDYGISGLYYEDAKPVNATQAPAPVVEEDYGDYQAIEVVPGTSTSETEETPTEAPTAAPTEAPTEAPTVAPTAAPTEIPTQDLKNVKAVVKPDAGDKVHFNLVLGGDAKLAVLYSENGSVQFDTIEFTQSGPVIGTVLSDDVSWGIAFYDANNYIFDTIQVTR